MMGVSTAIRYGISLIHKFHLLNTNSAGFGQNVKRKFIQHIDFRNASTVFERKFDYII